MNLLRNQNPTIFGLFGEYLWICLAAALVGLFSCSSKGPVTEKLYWSAPAAIPLVSPEMNTSGFWIGKIENPDQVILSRGEIDDLNREIREALGLTREILSLPGVVKGDEIQDDISHWLFRFRNKGRYYTEDGHLAGSGFFDPLIDNLDLDSLAGHRNVKWGVTTANSDQRLLPTHKPLYNRPGDIDFDRLQNNGLNLGTPVAVLHHTLDRKWVWVIGPDSNGWIRSDQIGLCTRERLKELKGANTVTIVRNRASLFQDQRLTRYTGFARMGVQFPLVESFADTVAVLLPFRQNNGGLELRTGYIKARDLSINPLAYTSRHMIEQAFEMLNSPYGWGGTHGNLDCSQFIQSVFATVGIHLPRNSAAQAQIGRELHRFTKGTSDSDPGQAVLVFAQPGISILYMKGHVMLYIGGADNRPYVIHDLWGYRAPGIQRENTRVTNRVLVTPLELGRDTSRGALSDRLISIRGVF